MLTPLSQITLGIFNVQFIADTHSMLITVKSAGIKYSLSRLKKVGTNSRVNFKHKIRDTDLAAHFVELEVLLLSLTAVHVVKNKLIHNNDLLTAYCRHEIVTIKFNSLFFHEL